MPGPHVREIREFRLEQRNGRWVEICLYVNTAGQLIRYVKLASPDDVRRIQEIGEKLPAPGEELDP
jgi:hypothetical protein